MKLHTTGNKVLFTSLGCPRNLVDTEVMLGILLKAGYEPCQHIQDADYVIVNTCGFLESARDESVNTVNDLCSQKKPSAKMIVTGCMAQSHPEDLKKRAPGINHLLGSGDVEKILEAVESDLQESNLVSSAKSYLQAGEVPRSVSTPKHYAYLKIAEGCAKKCAYCIIPKIKGGLKSKDAEQVVREFRALRKQGVEEIILIAQDLGDWGKDKGIKNGLETLLTELIKEEGDFWIRLMYLYPDEITDELLDLIRKDKRILPYLDMPIQHINDTMLQAMKRKTSAEQIKHIISKLRKELPEVVIRTSLIVGFPGETEEQFEELVQFIQEYPLDNIGVFTYSREEGAPAATMDGQIDESIKQERRDRLMRIQQEIVMDRNKKYIGKVLDVFLESYHPETKHLMLGRYYGQCPEIDGSVIINDHRAAKAFGKRHKVEITEVSGYDLVGRVLPSDVTPRKAKLAMAH